jgi:hypothetical protein
MAVIGTKFTVRDAAGNALCHSSGQSKAAANSARKRATREAFALMCEAAGSMREGEYLDVITGAFLPMSDAQTGAQDWGVVERGHVIADAMGGAFCPCNLVPENRGSNKGHGNTSMDPRTWRGADPRSAWREVWLTHYATKAKASKAV